MKMDDVYNTALKDLVQNDCKVGKVTYATNEKESRSPDEVTVQKIIVEYIPKN